MDRRDFIRQTICALTAGVIPVAELEKLVEEFNELPVCSNSTFHELVTTTLRNNGYLIQENIMANNALYNRLTKRG